MGNDVETGGPLIEIRQAAACPCDPSREQQHHRIRFVDTR